METLHQIVELEIRQKINKELEVDEVSCPPDAIKVASKCIGSTTNENLLIFAMNVKNQIVGVNKAKIGTLSSTMVNIRDIAQTCFLTNTVACIIAHNHPSGDLTPSPSDEETFRHLLKTLPTIEINLLDFIIVNDEEGVSLREMHQELF